MRSSRVGLLVSACLLASVLASVAPADAADPAPQIRPGTIEAQRPAAPSGIREPYRAEIWIGTDRLREEPLELQVKEADQTVFVTRAIASTGADGHQAEVRVALRFNAQLRWHHPATAKAPETYSVVLDQAVSPRVGAVVNDRTLRMRQLLVVRGTVRPAKPGRIVRLFAGLRTDPVLLASARIAEDGSYRLTRRFLRPGARRLFVQVPASNRNSAGWSSYRFVRVR